MDGPHMLLELHGGCRTVCPNNRKLKSNLFSPLNFLNRANISKIRVSHQNPVWGGALRLRMVTHVCLALAGGTMDGRARLNLTQPNPAYGLSPRVYLDSAGVLMQSMARLNLT